MVELAELYDKIFVAGQFVAADGSVLLTHPGETCNLSEDIAQYTFQQRDYLVYPQAQVLASVLAKDLAEFAKANINVAIVDLNNEMRLYRSLIQPAPARSQPVRKDEFATMLQDSIKAYEDVAARQAKRGKDKTQAENVIATLKAQLKQHLATTISDSKLPEGMQKSLSTATLQMPPLTRDDRRIVSLREIFFFYNRQRALACLRRTFEAENEAATMMPLGYVLKFVKDFAISVSALVPMIVTHDVRKSENCL
jgi:hypothetical protein